MANKKFIVLHATTVTVTHLTSGKQRRDWMFEWWVLHKYVHAHALEKEFVYSSKIFVENYC